MKELAAGIWTAEFLLKLGRLFGLSEDLLSRVFDSYKDNSQER